MRWHLAVTLVTRLADAATAKQSSAFFDWPSSAHIFAEAHPHEVPVEADHTAPD
jgi:hypothetical protein